jgi:hypothetical protein
MPSIEDLKAAAEALTTPKPERKEISKEEDLQNIMAQIKALPAAPPQPTSLGTTQEPPKAPPALAEPPAPPITTPEIPKPPPDAPPWLHDIVQVVDKESRFWGVLFQLGDIKDGKAHGYRIKEGGAREFFTVGANQIHTIGESKVRLKRPCSDQWMGEQRT